MAMNYLLEYSYNYSMTTGSLRYFHIDKVNDDDMNENNNDNFRVNNEKETANKPFEYKAKTIGGKPDDNDTLDTKADVSLKYFSDFWMICL